MEIATTKVSSRGQIVIPQEMRSKLRTGEKLVIIENENQFILKRSSEMSKHFEEDLAFAKRTNKKLEDYEAGKGNFTELSEEDFLTELDTW